MARDRARGYAAGRSAAVLICLCLITEELSACPSEDWAQLNDMCYLFPTKIDVYGLDTAQMICDGFQPNSTVASIHDLTTNGFLSSMLGASIWGAAWVGLTRQGDGVTFTWTDGSEVDFQNWCYSNPVYGYNCVFLTHNPDCWVSADCANYAAPPLCQYPA